MMLFMPAPEAPILVVDNDPKIVALSWKAQRRLHHVWSRMEQRGKRRTIIAVACARELAGFCWAVATTD